MWVFELSNCALSSIHVKTKLIPLSNAVYLKMKLTRSIAQTFLELVG